MREYCSDEVLIFWQSNIDKLYTGSFSVRAEHKDTEILYTCIYTVLENLNYIS